MTTAVSMFKGETQADSSSLKTLYDSFRQTVEDMTTQVLSHFDIIYNDTDHVKSTTEIIPVCP